MYNIFPTTLWTIFQQILVLSPIPCLNHTMTKLSSLLSCIKSKQYTTQKWVGLLVVLKLKLGSIFILIVFRILTLSIMLRLKDSWRQTQPPINYPYITCIIKVFENVNYTIKLYMCIYEVYYTLEFPNVFQNPYKKHASTNYILK